MSIKAYAKKIVPLTILVMAVVLLLPSDVFAQGNLCTPGERPDTTGFSIWNYLPYCDLRCENYTLDALIQIVVGFIKLILGMTGSAALVMFVYAGFQLMISRGETGKIAKAKETIKNAVIGMALIFGSWLIVNTFVGFLIDPSKVPTGIAKIPVFSNVDIWTYGAKVCTPIKMQELGDRVALDKPIEPQTSSSAGSFITAPAQVPVQKNKTWNECYNSCLLKRDGQNIPNTEVGGSTGSSISLVEKFGTITGRPVVAANVQDKTTKQDCKCFNIDQVDNIYRTLASGSRQCGELLSMEAGGAGSVQGTKCDVNDSAVRTSLTTELLNHYKTTRPNVSSDVNEASAENTYNTFSSTIKCSDVKAAGVKSYCDFKGLCCAQVAPNSGDYVSLFASDGSGNQLVPFRECSPKAQEVVRQKNVRVVFVPSTAGNCESSNDVSSATLGWNPK